MGIEESGGEEEQQRDSREEPARQDAGRGAAGALREVRGAGARRPSALRCASLPCLLIPGSCHKRLALGAGLSGLVEFLEAHQAKAAFKAIAYTRFKDKPFFLEWAPHQVTRLTGSAPSSHEGLELDATVCCGGGG